MRKRHNAALLSLLAVILIAVISIAGMGSNSSSLASVLASSSGLSNAPNSVWVQPVDISNSTAYDNISFIAASPLNGAALSVWGRANGNAGQIISTNNSALGGAFSAPHVVDADQPSLIDVLGIAHDSLGRKHALSWRWPSNQNLCDYYKQFDTNGNMTVNQAIPGSCSSSTPRKLGAIAIDSNLTVHIILGRNGVAGSMLYWERNNAGVWTVQGEPVPSGCAPSDLSIAVSSQSTVMIAWKDCAQSNQGTDIHTAVRLAANNWQDTNISSSCCSACPNTSGAYLPYLAADPSGGLRIAWVDGRCTTDGPTDIYYREWTPGNGWNGHPIVQVVNNAGKSYYPTLAVDATGQAHIIWGDDTNSPFAYYRIFYSHGQGTVFSAPEVPFNASFPSSWQRDPAIDFAYNAVHVSFSSIRNDPNKDIYYAYTSTSPPPTPTPLPPPCPGEQFHDVCPGTYYYTPVAHLVSAGVLSGYNTAPPCPAASWIPCFLPNSYATRGQIAKIITLGAGLTINTTGGPHFTDVPTNNTFYQYIETMYNDGDVSGYTTGCDTGSPCFHPNNNVTRGQLTKMASLAFGFNEAVSGQDFQDVPNPSTFYVYIERLFGRGIIGGYPCGGATEPCGPGSKPYFRTNNNVTRGQLAKIVDLCRQQP